MKRFSKIILVIWIICGLAVGNVYAYTQYSGIKTASKTRICIKSSEAYTQGVYTEFHTKRSDAIIECENELEDDDEKFIAETITFNHKFQELYLPIARYKLTECQTRSKSLNILYCVFRV